MHSNDDSSAPSQRTDPLVPLSIFLHKPGVPWEEQSPPAQRPPMCLDAAAVASIASQLIDRAIEDPSFRDLIKKDPLKALKDMGVVLSPELEEYLRTKSHVEPDLLLRTMLGPEFPHCIAKHGPHLVVQRTVRPQIEPTLYQSTDGADV